MAELLAKIIQRITRINNFKIILIEVGANDIVCQRGTIEIVELNTPKKNPIIAKGIANMV